MYYLFQRRFINKGCLVLWLDKDTVSRNSLEDGCLLYFHVWLPPPRGEFSSIT